MTAKPAPPTDTGTGERREHGLALADALLKHGRELSPLNGAAHARVKRRLMASTRRRPFGRVGWLRPAVIVSLFLVCGAAFGVALDRVVLKRGGGGMTTPSDGESSPGRSRVRSGWTSPKAPQPLAAEASPGSDGVAAELPSAKEMARPATGGEVVAAPAIPSPAHASSHSRKLALRAEPSDTSFRQSPSGWQDVTPVAPADIPAERPALAVPPAPAALPVPAAAAGQAPAPPPPPSILPATAPAASPSGNPAKRPARDSLSEERLLAAAVRALRAETNPRSALTALDEYRAHYPHGRLFVEAEVLRVDALAALKHTPEALRVLDGLDFAEMPGGLARQVQRGELRAASGRQREAETDFANVLLRAHSQDLDLVERALWGRAQSRASFGDENGARLDANEYLRRFPNGRFAAAAARMGTAIAP